MGSEDSTERWVEQDELYGCPECCLEEISRLHLRNELKTEEAQQTPGVRRWNGHSSEAKAARVCRQRTGQGDSNTKRELWRFAKDPFQSLAEYGSYMTA